MCMTSFRLVFDSICVRFVVGEVQMNWHWFRAIRIQFAVKWSFLSCALQFDREFESFVFVTSRMVCTCVWVSCVFDSCHSKYFIIIIERMGNITLSRFTLYILFFSFSFLLMPWVDGSSDFHSFNFCFRINLSVRNIFFLRVTSLRSVFLFF